MFCSIWNGIIVFLNKFIMEDLQQRRDLSGTTRFKRLSWSAVLAGVIIAIIVQMLLSLLGLGIGLSSFSPATEEDPLSGFGTGASLWWLISILISLFVGGLVTGWLSDSYNKMDNVLHGALAWGVFALVSLYIVTSSIGSILGGLGNVVGKSFSTVGSVVKDAAPDMSAAIGNQIGIKNEDLETLKNEAKTILRQTGKKELQPENIKKEVNKASNEIEKSSKDVAQNPNDIDDEAKSLYNKLFDLKENILSAADQDALANIVAQRTGKSKEESKELVANWAQAADNVKQQIKETAHEASEKAKKIGDDASDAVGKAAILGFFALLLGALASIGGSVLANNKRQSTYRNSVS